MQRLGALEALAELGAAGLPLRRQGLLFALAREALSGGTEADGETQAKLVKACDRAAEWLVSQVESGAWTEPAPIGFYFAKLWYYEKLYPMIATVAALSSYRRLADKPE